MKRDSVVALVGLPAPSRPLVSPHVGWVLAGCLVLFGAACGSTVSGNDRPMGLQRIERAIDFAGQGRTYRLNGAVMIHGPLVAWDGIVVDGDEQYTIHTLGMLIESRRINGASWARRLDTGEPWMKVPSDHPIDLTALLLGTEAHTEQSGDDWRITLRFDHVDVLAALTHIPSTGPSTAVVRLSEGAIAEVTLQLRGADARISFSSYGENLSIEPIPPSASPQAP
jgi:hypothetical protein